MTSPSPSDTLALTPTGDELRVRRFWLKVVSGRDEGKSVASSGEKLVVGSHESADLVLDDEAASRFHCEIDVCGGRPVLRDLESRNGTLLDGVSVVTALPKDGALLTIGRTKVRFELRAEESRVPLSKRERFGTMVGHGPAMRRVFAVLERAAASDAAVLLEGETGTGKEVAAESIHLESPRKDGPFVVVDCGAIPANLLEAELFGHEKGAFTGALSARKGAFEAANGGTIFLDEIGELPPDLQPKLLRTLEKKHIKRIGSTEWQSVDVRVVAATNRSLRVEVNEKRFRSDLFFRLAVLEVRLPPLRERLEDLAPLVDNLLVGLGATEEQRRELTTPSTLAELSRHGWSGNVREVRNYLERCMAMRELLPLEGHAGALAPGLPDATVPLKVARDRWTRLMERAYLEDCLRRSEDNVAAAARLAQVDRMHFYRLLWKHGLR